MLFAVLLCLFTQKFSSSIIRHFFCPSACSRGGGYNVPLLRLLMSPAFYPLHILTEFLYCCLSISVPHSFYSWANSFPFQAVWCSCLSLSVSLPLFWHLHAVKDRQTLHRHWQVVPRHKTGFDAVSGRLQNVWPTLYIKALWSLRSGKRDSRSTSDGPSRVLTNVVKNMLFTSCIPD